LPFKVGVGVLVFKGNIVWHFALILQVKIIDLFYFALTLWRPAAFGDFRKKTPKRTWLCAGISPVW